MSQLPTQLSLKSVFLWSKRGFSLVPLNVSPVGRGYMECEWTVGCVIAILLGAGTRLSDHAEILELVLLACHLDLMSGDSRHIF